MQYRGDDRLVLARSPELPPSTCTWRSPPSTTETCERFHAAAIEAGYESNGGPGERPRYHPGYYAAYVLDPDGNNIEVVNHHDRAERPA